MTFAEAQEKIKELASNGKPAYMVCLHFIEHYEFDVREGRNPRQMESDKGKG